jgi:hypothetical protein
MHKPTFPFFSGQSSIKRDGDGAEKDSEREKAIVLFQAIAFFFLLYFSSFRASANPSFPIEKHVKKSK